MEHFLQTETHGGDFKTKIDNSHLVLLGLLTHPEVDVGSEEGELGEGGEDQEERLHFPVDVNFFHLVEQQEELPEVLKIRFNK